MSYIFTQEETSKVWPRRQTVRQFLHKGASRIVERNINDIYNELSVAFVNVMTDLIKHAAMVEKPLTDLAQDLHGYKASIIIDERFVR